MKKRVSTFGSEMTTMTKIRQATFSLLVLPAFIAITNQSTWAAEKSAKLATVRIGYVSRSILDMPYMIARDRGLFREEGLEPELIFIKAAQTIPAMLAEGSILAQRPEPLSPPR